MKMNTNNKLVFEVLFGALLLSLPFSNFFTPFFSLLLLVALIVFVPFKTIKNNIGKNWVVWCWIVFVFWQALSFLYTENLKATLEDFGMKLPLALLPAIIWAFPKVSIDTKNRLKFIFIAGITLAALAALVFAAKQTYSTGLWYTYYPETTIIENWNFLYKGLAKPIMHPGYFALFVGAAIFVAFDLGFSSKQKPTIKPVISIVLIVFFLVFMFLLAGRINLLAFAIVAGFSILIYLIRQKRYLHLSLFVGVPIVMATLFIAFAPKDRFGRFFEPINTDYNLSSNDHNDFTGLTIRLAQWNSAWKLINAKPILGESTGDAKIALIDQYKKDGFVIGILLNYNCHNQFIETALQSGYPGMFLLILAFAASIYAALKTRNYVAVAVLLYIAICLLTESVLQRQKGVALLSTVLPLLLLKTLPKEE